ncbi:MAG TPA: TonB-dependent receptor [Pyrinomonadaceae bacterium]|nr:TonB-dependent receptor [Pyrinomonadaceae bacterium]
MKKFFSVFFAILSIAISSYAQSSGKISGTVTSQINAMPVPNASVRITQLQRSVETDEQGKYEFTDVPAGRYTIVTHLDGFTDQVESVVVAANSSITADFALRISALQAEVTVTASGSEESVFESFQSVSSVGSTRILEQASTSVGEVLEREAGVGKRAFGPGSSRPVIRGFDGDRVLVLQDGSRNGSLGSQSADHGEPIDTMNLERLEVIKGPATLLYGSNAIGGVVNAVTTDEADPHPGFRGYLSGVGATNNKQGGLGGGIEYGYKKLLLNLNGNTMRDGDYRTPLGRIPNSQSRSYGGNSSIGYFADKGFVIGSFGLDRRRYGVPYAALYEEGALLTDGNGDPCVTKKEGEEECQYDIFGIQARFANQLPETPDEEIDLRMKRNNYRLRGGFRNVKGPISQGNFSIDRTDYRHEEVETADGIDKTATNFFNDTVSYRASFRQANYKMLSGQFGFEGYNRSYLTEGAEQLVNGRVRQSNFAVFGLQELGFERVAIQFGGRIEHNKYKPVNTAEYEQRDFTGFSGAAAARFRLWEGAAFIANFTSAYRAPSLEELYNNGPHIGTVTFEVGDQDLTRERSTGIEFSLRQQLKRVRLNGSFFSYNIDNFIYLAPQDEDGNGNIDVDDNLPVGAFSQRDARFTGVDLSADFDINDWLSAFMSADYVNAKLKNGGGPLPRITPIRFRGGVDVRYKGLSVRPEVILVGARDLGNTFSLETPTDGYALFNVNASYTIAKKHAAHTFAFSSSNLGDKLYRNHLSFIKDLTPEQGRNFRFSYSVRFF